MISEFGFGLIAITSILLFLAGILGKRSILTVMGAGGAYLSAFLGFNVGDDVAGVIFFDYAYLGIFMLLMAISASIAFIVQLFGRE